MQEQLDEIATVYYGHSQGDARRDIRHQDSERVREFQSIFGLPQTGVVDFATWYKNIAYLCGITRIAELVCNHLICSMVKKEVKI